MVCGPSSSWFTVTEFHVGTLCHGKAAAAMLFTEFDDGTLCHGKAVVPFIGFFSPPPLLNG
jgi:hypothetical protein